LTVAMFLKLFRSREDYLKRFRHISADVMCSVG
jgi:hypothetical protein